MKISAHIDRDYKSLRRYFERLFDLLDEIQSEDQSAPVEAVDAYADRSQESHYRTSHLVIPDMVVNVYSYLEYWLVRVCDKHKEEQGLSLSCRDIKGNNDLHAYRKYLVRYVGADLSQVDTCYQDLQDLRKVRRVIVHKGGHITDQKLDEFKRINGVRINMGLIRLSREFVRSQLKCAHQYLLGAV